MGTSVTSACWQAGLKSAKGKKPLTSHSTRGKDEGQAEVGNDLVQLESRQFVHSVTPHALHCATRRTACDPEKSTDLRGVLLLLPSAHMHRIAPAQYLLCDAPRVLWLNGR